MHGDESVVPARRDGGCRARKRPVSSLAVSPGLRRVGATAIALAAMAAALAAAPIQAQSPTAAALRSVPTQRCSIQLGAPQDVPRHARARVWFGSTALAAYDGGLRVLAAPSGWRCRVAIGADGSSFSVLAPSPIGLANGFLPRTPTGAAVTYQGSSACVGCAYDLACHYFHLPRQDLPCSGPDPTRHQKVARLGARVVAFSEPPTAKHRYVLHGVVIDLQSSSGGAQPLDLAVEATCSLPPAQLPLCTQILNEVLHQNGVY
jgi:hypothetical protein